MITIVHPAAEDLIEALDIAPRLATLSGARIGVIDNSIHKADLLLREVEELLQSRYGVKSFARYQKSNVSVGTPPEKLKEIVSETDAIIHGVAA